MKRSHWIRPLLAFGALIALALVLLFANDYKAHRQSAQHEQTQSQAEAPTEQGGSSHPLSHRAGLPPTRLSRVEAALAAVRIVQSIYNTPISFYGKVQDQFGNPIPGATIKYEVVDKFWADGSQYTGSSDLNGLFFISNIGGAGLTVGVLKDGYDDIRGKSSQTFGYGMGPDEYRKAPPTENAPAIFVLRKMEKAERLIVKDNYVPVPRDGTPVLIDLKQGQRVPSRTGDIQVECWTSEELQDARRHYPWHCRVTVPGGGIMERGGQHDQQAPSDGYVSSIEFDMKQDAPRWTPTLGGEYFLKLGSGCYARARISMVSGGDNFISVESYLNPNVGSRNLEYDTRVQDAQP